MGDGIFEIECPCCGATIDIDSATQVVLSHQRPEPKRVHQSFGDAVEQLKSEESTRDERFNKQFEAERKHGQELTKKFDGLLKKTRAEGPVKPVLRDIDLD